MVVDKISVPEKVPDKVIELFTFWSFDLLWNDVVRNCVPEMNGQIYAMILAIKSGHFLKRPPPNSWQQHFTTFSDIFRHFPTRHRQFPTQHRQFPYDIDNFWRYTDNFRYDIDNFRRYTDNFRRDTEILQPRILQHFSTKFYDILRHFPTQHRQFPTRHRQFPTLHRQFPTLHRQFPTPYRDFTTPQLEDNITSADLLSYTTHGSRVDLENRVSVSCL